MLGMLYIVLGAILAPSNLCAPVEPIITTKQAIDSKTEREGTTVNVSTVNNEEGDEKPSDSTPTTKRDLSIEAEELLELEGIKNAGSDVKRFAKKHVKEMKKKDQKISKLENEKGALERDKEHEKNNTRVKEQLLRASEFPNEFNNEIDRFQELYSWQINFTKKEETELSKISDKHVRSRRRFSLMCQHAIEDLREEPLIKELNAEIDSENYKHLAELEPKDRRKHVCEALIMVKYDRNVKVHQMFIAGDKVKLVRFFANDVLNEGITAFYNAHKTGIEFQGIISQNDSILFPQKDSILDF